ncbi:hypothetical protein [Evansella tamaricis]|uniref:Uncharacterized protein n=1 Tax=Evansella tamaricis TaxID=2069301 RepID=A0ABS6JMC8_9BACI|nr:hypothetical protein [Evansella tamaricis]MBU9714835.1 hypothetical protein [Evansella tamaricis]
MVGQYIVSCMQMARSAEIGLFIHRYELIMIIFFSISALVQVMISILCTTIALKHVTGITKLNKLIFPVSLLLGAFGYWVVEDHIRAMDLLTYYWPIMANPIGLGLPLLIFLLGFFFQKK